MGARPDRPGRLDAQQALQGRHPNAHHKYRSARRPAEPTAIKRFPPIVLKELSNQSPPASLIRSDHQASQVHEGQRPIYRPPDRPVHDDDVSASSWQPRESGQDRQDDGERQRVPAEQADQVLQRAASGVVVQPPSSAASATPSTPGSAPTPARQNTARPCARKSNRGTTLHPARPARTPHASSSDRPLPDPRSPYARLLRWPSRSSHADELDNKEELVRHAQGGVDYPLLGRPEGMIGAEGSPRSMT